MTFVDDIARVAEQVRKRINAISGEEATKMAIIVPFLGVLGYDAFEPTEVIPEYVADFAVSSGKKPFDKVDYAISINNTIVMLIEAKAHDKKPEVHDGQLRKYFNSLVPAKVAVVTNGIEYRFFTDLDEPNIMDGKPFFCFDILNYDQKQIESLKFFHRDNFNTQEIKHHAEELVYLNGVSHLVGGLLRSPSDDFIRFLIKNLGAEYAVANKVVNARVIEKFRLLVKKSIQTTLVELMTQSINKEMGQPNDEALEEFEDTQNEVEQEVEGVQVETTAEELDAFERIKSITARSQSFNLEVNYKDVLSYFGVNVGKTTWWFLRLYLSPKKKSFVTRLPINDVKSLAPGFEVQEMSASFGDAASRVIISSVNDLDQLSDLIVKCYETEAAKRVSRMAA
jgi:predicted type IV restriction endonuclease